MSIRIHIVYALMIKKVVRSQEKLKSDAKLIKKYVNKIKEEYKDDITVKCGYEAGCLGFFFKSSRN